MKSLNETNSKKHIINISIILAISVFVTFMFTGFNSSWQSILLNILYGIIIGLSIAIGSSFISRKMFSIGNWEHNPINKYVQVIIAITVYISIDVVIINLIWFKITQNLSPTDLIHSNMFVWIILTELVIGIIIYLVILSANFSKLLNQFHIDAEKAQKEINKYKYSTLKNQVNPHFLFNSLNVLSGLIYKDVEKADDFVGKLASIYRYVLDVQDEEVVSLGQELSFIKDYLFLQRIRFGDNLSYEINANSDKMIIPMALQILIENALKHNTITNENKLEIKISSDERYVIVSNNKNVKSDIETSHELGIANIKARYTFLTTTEVEVLNSENKFEVRIPLLNIKA